MNNKLAPMDNTKHSLVVTMAKKYGLEPAKFLTVLANTIFPTGGGAPSQEQIAAFLVVANQYELSPFIKEIYAFPGKSGGIVPIVSIDGWLSLINRQPDLDGFDFEDDWQTNDKGERYLVSVTVKIYRKSRTHPTVVTEYMAECYRNTDPWKKWPVRMLRHKTLIQGARYAFGLSGIVDPDEAERIAEAGGDATPAAPMADKTAASAADLRDKIEKEKAKAQNEPTPEPPTVEPAIVTEEDGPEYAAETVIEGQVIDAEFTDVTDFEEEPAEEPTEEQITENLRANAQSIYNDLDKETKKRVIVGRPMIKEMTREQLDEFLPILNDAINAR
jgi:phage recombination protein Bet